MGRRAVLISAGGIMRSPCSPPRSPDRSGPATWQHANAHPVPNLQAAAVDGRVEYHERGLVDLVFVLDGLAGVADDNDVGLGAGGGERVAWAGARTRGWGRAGLDAHLRPGRQGPAVQAGIELLESGL